MTPSDRTQSRLLILAAIFLLISSAVLTLAPAARARSWQVEYRWDHWLGVFVWCLSFFAAHHFTVRRLPERDPYLLPITSLLAGWGLLTIYRITPAFGLRQSLWLAASITVFILGLRLPSDLEFVRKYKYLWLTTGIILTALTLILGTNPLGQGPRLWLGCCGVYFQPSEPLKLLLIVYLSAYFAPLASAQKSTAAHPDIPLLPLLAPTILMTGLAAAILLAQRDLGTGSIFFFLYAVLVYLATGRRRVILTAALALSVTGLISYFLFDVVQVRIQAWLNPWNDPSGRSYQIVQSLMAVANGGLFGRGPGLGSPGLVPVAHSDFIFSAIAEENGLLGIFALLLMYGLLLERGFRAALRSPSLFTRLLAAGISAHLVAQSILIMGGNLRLLPLTGVTLPFVSYGGSSLLTSFLTLLLLLHISNLNPTVPSGEPSDNRRYLQLAGLLMAGLAAVAFISSWWAIYRAPDLLLRTDNPRRTIADRFVPRGHILDRNNQPLAVTVGSPGDLSRQVIMPGLSVIIGYNNPTYGQSGLEASMDAYLRGTKGYPVLTVYWSNLLYGQPPPGHDIRLSLDQELQRMADEALVGRVGALVLMQAHTGEILVMASHPGFDANSLEQDWQINIQSSSAPFLNRASQGLYPADELVRVLFPGLEDVDQLTIPPADGLPGPQEFTGAGFNMSPLQMCVAAAAITADGVQPVPSLVTGYQSASGEWELLTSSQQSREILPPAQAKQQRQTLAQPEDFFWQSSISQQNSDAGSITWYVAGTRPEWGGAPLSIALVLEENNIPMAEQIGRQMLQAAMTP